MEENMKTAGFVTLYTIARAASIGINATFAKCGYTFAGTLINNTQISGRIESMNVWYKNLPEHTWHPVSLTAKTSRMPAFAKTYSPHMTLCGHEYPRHCPAVQRGRTTGEFTSSIKGGSRWSHKDPCDLRQPRR